MAGENETDGGNRFSSRSIGVEAAIEPVVRLSAQRGCKGENSGLLLFVSTRTRIWKLSRLRTSGLKH